MTVQVIWKVLARGLTFQLPQQSAIIRIASHGEFYHVRFTLLLQ